MSEHNVPDRHAVALITVDLQRDFVCQGSPVQASGVSAALPHIDHILTAFRNLDKPIFHAVRLYRPDGSNVDLCRRSAVEEGLRVLMPGTSGAELIDAIKPDVTQRLEADALLEGEFQQLRANELVFYKPRWSAFFRTALEDRLQALGVNTLVITGLNFPTGGRATIYDAGSRDFRVVVGSDALCDAREEALRELGRIGVYQMTSEALVEWLHGHRRATAA
ncbi:MAG TPA: cysteine hydrolase [Kiloniellales bacterium]|nr:cysteine hydrolase [Kiloniellales bacterium]